MTDRRIAFGLFALALLACAWFFGGAGWNQNANFDLTRALVERRTLYIDGYDINTGDVSPGRGGHTYSNKPPGVSMLAAIPYSVVFAFEKLRHMPIDALARTNAWITTAATCGVCGALIAATLFLYGRKLGIPQRAALVVSLLVLFGTIVFPYSTMLFAHVPSAMFFLLAFAWRRDRPFLAGLAAGAATACFYVCAIPALILLPRRNALHYIAGGIPFAILLAIYHDLCFGSPWTTSVETSAFTGSGLLFGVLRLPSLEAMWGLTFSPWRGLFFASPVLLFAIAGFVRMWRRRDLRGEAWCIAASALLYFAVISSFNFWDGGWAFGPRYLMPIIPLLGIPMMFAVDFARPLWILLGAASVTINFLATAVGPMPPDPIRNPIFDWVVPIFVTGHVPEKTRHILQWEDKPMGSVAVLPEAGNLGEMLFGARTRVSIILVLVWLLAGASILVVRAAPA